MPEPEENQQTGEGAADQETGELAGAADLQNTGEDNTGAAGQETSDAQIEAFKAKAEDEVAKRQNLETEVRQLRELVQTNQPQTQAPATPQDVFSREGLEGYESPSVEQIRQNQTEQTARVLTVLQHQNFINSNPDYSEIVGTVGPTGRFDCAEPFKELMQDDPNLRGLDNFIALNPALAPVAYRLAQQHKALKDSNAKNAAAKEYQAQLDIANRTGPLSPAAVGGGGGALQTEDLSDEQVEELDTRINAGEFG